MKKRVNTPFSSLKVWSTARALLCLLPLALSSCKGSPLSDQFYQGARRQDGLDSDSLFLWSRSPAVASGNTNILSTDSLDNLVSKNLVVFTNVVNIYEPIRSEDLVMHYSHINEDAPNFYEWAGRYVPWKNNPDFRVLFAYNELNQGIAYVDSLFAKSYMYELPTKLYAWRDAVCTTGRGERSCSTAAELLAAPVLPLYVSVDNATKPGGANASSGDAHFCPYFDSEYAMSPLKACHGRSYADDTSSTPRTWQTDWHSGRTRRQISFYRDRSETTFNWVDDGDMVIHELGHAFLTALRPEVLELELESFKQLEALVEGTADFFVAAYRRDDEILRYTMQNTYPLFPSGYAGELSGAYRDPENSIYLPDGYISETPYDLGRILAGAMNDYRRVLQGEDIAKLSSESNIPGLKVGGVGKYGVEAWDMAIGVLARAFYTMSTVTSDHTFTLNGFAGHLLTTCSDLEDLSADFCAEAQLKLVLENRGLIAKHYFAVASYAARNPSTQDIAVSGGNRFLFQIGKSNVVGDNINLRYGMTMSETLGWIPFRPNGSDEFANNDAVVNPCEAIVVFPNIENRTDLGIWKDLSGARGIPGSFDGIPFEAITGSVASYDTIPVAARGVVLSELKWTLAATPRGFTQFQHPTLGYIDPYDGLDPADIRGLPILKPGQNVQAVARDETLGLYKIWQERAFDLPWASKGVAKSKVGWLFKAPSEAWDADEANESAYLTFKIAYSAFNSKTAQSIDVDKVRMFPADSAETVLTSLPYDTVSQYIRVSETDAGFCD